MKIISRALFAALAVAACAGTATANTCSVDQTGKTISTTWVADAPANISDMVRSKLTILAYGQLSGGKFVTNEMPGALITCYGTDGVPNLIQQVRVIAKDRKSGKQCAISPTFFTKGSDTTKTECDADFTTDISVP